MDSNAAHSSQISADSGDSGSRPPQNSANFSVLPSASSNNIGGQAHGSASATEENTDLEQLEAFARVFKARRIALGLSWSDLAQKFGIPDLSSTTISRFEALNLSFRNMCKLKPILQNWLDESSNLEAQHVTPQVQNVGAVENQTSRTVSMQEQVAILNESFLVNPTPTFQQIREISEKIGVAEEIITAWFSNKRQGQS